MMFMFSTKNNSNKTNLNQVYWNQYKRLQKPSQLWMNLKWLKCLGDKKSLIIILTYKTTSYNKVIIIIKNEYELKEISFFVGFNIGEY